MGRLHLTDAPPCGPHVRTHVSPAALRKATALEALVGHLHLTDAPRLEKVMAWLLQRMDGRTAAGSLD